MKRCFGIIEKKRCLLASSEGGLPSHSTSARRYQEKLRTHGPRTDGNECFSAKEEMRGEEKVEEDAGLRCALMACVSSPEKEGLEPQRSIRSSDLWLRECRTSAFYRSGMKNVFN